MFLCFFPGVAKPPHGRRTVLTSSSVDGTGGDRWVRRGAAEAVDDGGDGTPDGHRGGLPEDGRRRPGGEAAMSKCSIVG
eukprot:1181411-Prorocentrum_minimum.AAC.9